MVRETRKLPPSPPGCAPGPDGESPTGPALPGLARAGRVGSLTRALRLATPCDISDPRPATTGSDPGLARARATRLNFESVPVWQAGRGAGNQEGSAMRVRASRSVMKGAGAAPRRTP